MIAGNGKDRRSELRQESCSAGELISTSAMTEIAACDHELGLETLDQHRCTAFDRGVVSCAVMQVRQVQNASKHRGGSL